MIDGEPIDGEPIDGELIDDEPMAGEPESRAQVLRVAELIQADEDAVREAVGELPRTMISCVRSGVLLTLEHRRRWWDVRPRRVILAALLKRLDAIVSATSRVLVVGAAIERNGLILAAQRELPIELAGKWEFPGGKAELGESPETALIRECKEELAVDVVIGAELGRVQLPTGACLVVLRAVLADPSVEPRAVEHRQLRWCTPTELLDVDWLEHDLAFAQTLARGEHNANGPQPGLRETPR